MDNGSASISLALPIILAIEAEVTDSYGERISARSDVTVKQSARTNWQEAVGKVSTLKDD